jgi:hypothetical protein
MNSLTPIQHPFGCGLDGAKDGGPSRAMGRLKHNDIAGADGGEQALRSHPLHGCEFVPVFNVQQPLPYGRGSVL